MNNTKENSKEVSLSVIIVTWNSEEDIAECIGAIYNQNYPENFNIETIIVDNFSKDNTVAVVSSYIKIFPDERVKLIANKVNYGFTKGCNQGIEIARGKNIMLLNPDTQAIDNAMFKLVEYLRSDNSYGAIAPQLITKDGNVQYTCRRFPGYIDLFFELTLLSTIFSRSKFFARWKFKYFNHDEIAEVEQPMAAALMIKSEVLEKIEKLDERFYMFFNDIDVCKHIHDEGYKIIYYPPAKLFHKIGTSILKDRVRMIKAWNNDCLKYFKKNFNNPVLQPLLFIGLKITGFIRIVFTKIFYK